jgi:outer membrane protein TolC
MKAPSLPSRQICYFAVVAALCLQASRLSGAQEGAPMSLSDFLTQVRSGNGGVRGAADASLAQKDRSGEGSLLVMPTAFATFEYSHDGKPQVVPISSYSFEDTWQYSIGVSQTTTFGLTAKLSTNLYTLNYSNPSSFLSIFAGDTNDPFLRNLATSAAFPGTVNVTNQLELTQPLWGNAFGASTRANQDILEAQALASSYGNRYTARAALVDAESAYWNLATARQTVELTRQNLERAQKNYDWNTRRARLQLADESDALQSQAALEQRKLEYQSALDGEKAAARAFNTARGADGDSVPERLSDIQPQAILAMVPPKRAELRDDVKAAAQTNRATVASAEVARERDKPTLDIFGTVGMNGQDYGSLGAAYSQAVSFDHPTAVIGLRFTSPIAFGTASLARGAYAREQAASDLEYQRKLFEQEQSWRDLTDRLARSKRRLELAVSLERVQQAKLNHERERLRTGRSTSFQVLTFETDYAQSEISRIQSESEVLGILTQMKLFGEEL